MSIIDYLLEVIITILEALISMLPDSYSALSSNDFSNFIMRGLSSINSSFNFINNFIDLHLLFVFLGIIIFAEVLMHFGVKGFQYLIKIIAGRG